VPPTFVRPLTPFAADRPLKGDGWLHEPKCDGFRLQVIKDCNKVRFYSRNGKEFTERLPKMRRAFAELAADSAILDGKPCLIDATDATDFWRLMVEMRSRWRVPIGVTLKLDRVGAEPDWVLFLKQAIRC